MCHGSLHAQVMPEAFNVPLPSQYARVMSVFSFLNFDLLSSLVPHQCLGSFLQRLMAASIRSDSLPPVNRPL